MVISPNEVSGHWNYLINTHVNFGMPFIYITYVLSFTYQIFYLILDKTKTNVQVFYYILFKSGPKCVP